MRNRRVARPACFVYFSSMKVLGIMSGTSIDGVDYALCEVSARSVTLLKLWSREFPRVIQRRLHAAAANDCTSHELAQLHHDLGRLFAQQAESLNAKAQLVGLHGQTVYHHPDRNTPATLQLGEPAYLAEALTIPVVSNFRVADIAAGGQGAPLATLFHRIAFAQRSKHVCVNNLGGISNVTSLDWRIGFQPRITAFDTGPANVLIDIAMREFTDGRKTCDVNGASARRGRVNESLLSQWLRHRFFRAAPPKSTGRELFGEKFWRENRLGRRSKSSQFDLLATLTEFTARSMALNYRLHLRSLPDVVVLCGGGANNSFLVGRITAALRELNPETEVVTSEALDWPAQAVEPAAFALLAYYRWKELSGNIPTTTGARRAVLLGQVTSHK
jgi:anhydro-N-acetylmuramic acid kinase